jgi:hypothetical protein
VPHDITVEDFLDRAEVALTPSCQALPGDLGRVAAHVTSIRSHFDDPPGTPSRVTFAHTGPPFSPRLGRSSVTASPRSRRSSSRSPCSAAADRRSPERLRRERRTRSSRSVSDAAPCPLEDVLSHNRPTSIARLRLHFSRQQQRRSRWGNEVDQATGRRGLEFYAVAVGLLEHAAVPGDKRGGRATKLASLRPTKREASGRDKRNNRDSCSYMSWGSRAGHAPWDRQPLPTS